MLQRLAPHLQRLWQQLQELLLPSRCSGCGQPGTSLCQQCLVAIVRFPAPTCHHCDLPTTSQAPVCSTCQQAPASQMLRGLRLVGPHEEPLRGAIHALKYEGNRALATPLGALLAERWQTSGVFVDGILPVPLHLERQRERGYNQAELLAEVVGHSSGRPVQRELIWRTRATAPQVGLKREARHENVRGAFAASEAAAGGRWLLVDDVCTTGATLEACAGALGAAGAAEIWALTLARPYHQGRVLRPTDA
jgi:ComF family protein